MEKQFAKITKSSEYTDTCLEDYGEYYQLHILSYSNIFSNYYKKSEFHLDYVRNNTLKIQESIQNKTPFPIEASLYEKEGLFLITDSDEFINYFDLFEFNIKQGQYDYADNGMNLFDFIGEKPVDEFFKKALTTVGAASLIPKIEPFLPELIEEQANAMELYKEMREADKTSPLYLAEIYKIEKNYVPNKTHEFKCASIESATSLPEIKALVINDERATLVIKEIESGEIVEGSIEEAIEGIRYAKWVRKHPSVLNPDVVQRMKLDSDNPDFLSYAEYVATIDDFEEGDDEYEPKL